jgi:hypothetical protein
MTAVEHVFATQKHRMGLFIRTIGIERAKAKIGLANIAFNFKHFLYWESRLNTAWYTPPQRWSPNKVLQVDRKYPAGPPDPPNPASADLIMKPKSSKSRCPIGSLQGPIQRRPKYLEVDHSAQLLQRIARRRQRHIPLVQIEKATLYRHFPPPSLNAMESQSPPHRQR